jgi:hypothetical protein
MKLILSKLLYYCGDLVSKFLYFNCLSWLYPFYNKIMLLSCKLDKEGKVWQYNTQKFSDKQMKNFFKEVKKRKLHE